MYIEKRVGRKKEKNSRKRKKVSPFFFFILEKVGLYSFRFFFFSCDKSISFYINQEIEKSLLLKRFLKSR